MEKSTVDWCQAMFQIGASLVDLMYFDAGQAKIAFAHFLTSQLSELSIMFI